MKKPIFNLCNRLWDIVIPEDWKNQTDYPENTAYHSLLAGTYSLNNPPRTRHKTLEAATIKTVII